MIEILKEARGKILATRARGKLTKEDYELMVPTLEEMIKEYGNVRWYMELENFRGWEGKALWKDLKFDVQHINDFEKIAIVGEAKWEELMTVAMKPFTQADVKYFDEDNTAAAKVWIKG